MISPECSSERNGEDALISALNVTSYQLGVTPRLCWLSADAPEETRTSDGKLLQTETNIWAGSLVKVKDLALILPRVLGED